MQNTENAGLLCTYCRSELNSFFCNTDDIFDNSYEIRQCLNCKAFFLSPFPSDEMLQKAYAASYYGTTEQKFSFPFVEKAADHFRKRRAMKIVRLLPHNARVLDVGCGNGDFLRYVSLCGDYELYGIERDEIAAKRANIKTNIHIKPDALKENDFQENFFDAVTMFHVFEHLTVPQKTLEIISRILKPSGVLIISIPNIGSIQSRIFKGRWFHMDPPRHLLFFKPEDMIKILKNKSFVLLKSNYFSIEQNPYGWIQSILNISCKKREVLYERMKENKQYASEYGSFLMFFQKCFFVLSFPIFVVVSFFESVFKKGATVQFVFKNSKL